MIYRHLDRYHYLHDKRQNIGYMSHLDGWYVQNSSVYGSVSDASSDDDKVNYFYIDVCHDGYYVMPDYFKFDELLDKKARIRTNVTT